MFYAFFNALMKNFVIVKKSDNETNCGLLQSIYHANTVLYNSKTNLQCLKNKTIFNKSIPMKDQNDHSFTTFLQLGELKEAASREYLDFFFYESKPNRPLINRLNC